MSGTVGIIVAGGRGSRFGGPTPKQYCPVAGRPLLAWSIMALQTAELIDSVVVVIPPGDDALFREAVAPFCPADKLAAVVSGGSERSDSVLAGLDAVDPAVDVVAVHDGVRPLASRGLVNRLVEEARKGRCTVPGIPPRGTIKQCSADHRVTTTLDRRELVEVQTPQVFPRSTLVSAYQSLRPGQTSQFTDDSMVVEAAGNPVWVVPGEPWNIKVTYLEDMTVAEFLLSQRRR